MSSSTKVPNKLLDFLRANNNIETDADLASLIKVEPPVLSKIRHKTTSVSSSTILAIHECGQLNISLAQIRRLIAMQDELDKQQNTVLAVLKNY